MNLIESFQDLVAQVPELVQPLVVALAGAVPFIEGEGAAAIGIVGGINPVVAAIAAAVGNFVCVTLLVLFSSGARKAIVTRRAAVSANGAALPANDEQGPAPQEGESERKAARRAKFQRAFERYGVPGVSLLGPLLLPTHFTATMLAAAGIGRARVLAWQALAIAGWTTIVTLILTGVIHTFS
ncbi:small multidrug efflux protein [Microbacterium halophytorum]|uniref:small multidrug efflux protein n=1 Tax=Microbacterium halophytorum TaxID=2067568 RepID=UPI000CFB9573|nr:small multidrug efflux protein [Microbacterium halophytorum]